MLEKILGMTQAQYIKTLRFITIFIAFGLWATSIKFSVDGFNFNIEGMSYIAIFLGIAVTVIQLVWNHVGNSGNYTLVLGGVLAYAYGIYTNFTGILIAQGGNGGFIFDVNLIFPIVLALILEVLPEPLLIWGLTELTDIGDFVGNMVRDNSSKKSHTKSGVPQTSAVQRTSKRKSKYGG